jgi:cytochrome c553
MKTLVQVIAAVGVAFAARLILGARSRDEAVRAPSVRLAVKHPWVIVSAMAIGALLLAAAGVISGIVPIKASSGHWRITSLVLDFAKTRSVSTYSWGIEAPPLDDEALVMRGAGQYETACLTCHGGPGRGVPPVMAAMTPPPPELAPRLARWTPPQLFSIVKHGIKFTGMPGWPVQQRDDEVWAMVAFLRRMPQLDDVAYRQLIQPLTQQSTELAPPPAASAPREVQDLCWRCHGMDGTGRRPGAFPSLAGQRAEYLYASLRAFGDRSRYSGTMGEIAARLGDEARRAAAAYYAGLPPRRSEALDTVDENLIERGAAIASHGVPERDIPACVECHGPTSAPRNATYPILASQDTRYLREQLRLLQNRDRGGSANVTLMQAFVDRLSPEDIAAVTLYYGTAR